MMPNYPVANMNTEEKLIWYALVFGYVFYLTGMLYIVGSVLGWALFALFLLRWFVEGERAANSALPITVWVWLLGMLMMLVALLIGHSDFSLGMGLTIKSSVGWAKGWALLALFPLLGAMSSIRPQVIVRGVCVLAAQSIPFVLLGLVLAIAGSDGALYLSPLKAIGGPISSFEVGLFGINPETGRARWSFFSPWAPAAGLMSCLYLIICVNESNRLWRRMGIMGALVMCLFCQSRAGWAIFILLVPALYLLGQLKQPLLWLLLGTVVSAVCLLGQPLIEGAQTAHQQIKDSRAGSTRVREALATIAIQRWESEAPIWGHGVVERGPKMVEHMPIGSHHSWYGLLFVKGVVGLLALAVPLVITLVYLSADAVNSARSRSALLVVLVFTGYSFFENLEVLAYLYWPALIWLGLALNPIKNRELLSRGVTA